MFSNIIIGIRFSITEYANTFESDSIDFKNIDDENEYAEYLDQTVIECFEINLGMKTREMYLQRFVNEFENEKFIYVGICIINSAVNEVNSNEIEQCKIQIDKFMKLHKIEKEIKLYHLMYEDDE